MTPEQFEREKNYRVALAIAKTMLAQRLISDLDYKKIDSILLDKYHPPLGSICPQLT